MWQLNVDGCIWIGRGERGGGVGGGGEYERSRQEKEARGGWVGDKTDSNWCCCLRSLS